MNSQKTTDGGKNISIDLLGKKACAAGKILKEGEMFNKQVAKRVFFIVMSMFISNFSSATETEKEENISKKTISNAKLEKEDKENLEDIFRKSRKKPQKVHYDVEYYRCFMDQKVHSPEGGGVLTESH